MTPAAKPEDASRQRRIDDDHAEALNVARQIAAAGPGITPQHIIDLNRFCETSEDGEGYDVPKERMKALRGVGLVEGGRFGWYGTTEEGERLRDFWWEPMA